MCASFVPASPLANAPSTQQALADEIEEADTQLSISAQAYNDAVARQEDLEAEIEELDARIAELEEQLPAQQQRCDESVCTLYKYQSDVGSMLMMLLGSESITDMLAMFDQFNWIIDYNTAEITQTSQMKAELENSRSQVEADRQEAAEATSAAEAALEQAQAARLEAQERAAAAQAEEEAAKQAEIAASSATEEEKTAASTSAATESGTASATNVGWSTDKQAFVNEWAARIDAYLAGSPQAGCGTYYAAAAWDYGVDPRWAPAISHVESSKGANCFRSYNAWGYGSKSFSSWQEGIETVVRALGSSLYGGYLTREAAAIYCPSNSEHWYSTCTAQMALI